MSAHAVATAHGKEAARLRKLEATQRFKQAQAAQRKAEEFIQELAEIKGSAIRELRELYGWSWGDLQKEFGMTRQRMAQIGTR
jgi:hypothetical protein